MEAVYFLCHFSHPKWWAQLSLSPVPQFSPKSSPPNRDGPLYRKPLWATTLVRIYYKPLYRKPLWATTLVRIPTNLCTESHYGLQLWWGFLSANRGSQLRRCYTNNWITTPLLHTYTPPPWSPTMQLSSIQSFLWNSMACKLLSMQLYQTPPPP